MLNLVSGFVLVLFSQTNSMAVVNNPQRPNWAYETLENCKEAGSAATEQGKWTDFVCVPDASETEKND